MAILWKLHRPMPLDFFQRGEGSRGLASDIPLIDLVFAANKRATFRPPFLLPSNAGAFRRDYAIRRYYEHPLVLPQFRHL